MKRTHYSEIVVLALACCAAPRLALAAHTHGAAGPHGGELLELGADEYHAELVVDEKQNIVTVFVLDGAAQEEVPIDAPFLNVNVRAGGKPMQFRLNPVRAENQAGPTARFALQSPGLMAALHSGNSNPRLTMRIGKKSYVARIAHNHNHAHIQH